MPGTEHTKGSKLNFEFGNYLNFRNVGAKCKQNELRFTSKTSFGRDRMPGKEHTVDKKLNFKLGNYFNFRNAGAKCKQNDLYSTSQTSLRRDIMPGKVYTVEKNMQQMQQLTLSSLRSFLYSTFISVNVAFIC